MGLLDKLWDDTVAGPQPDSGLGRLRKFSVRTDLGGEPEEEPPKVTRSIMIRRPSGNGTPPPSPSPSPSPVGSTPPVSPLFGSAPGMGMREWNRFRRKSMSDAFDRASTGNTTTPMSSTPTSTVTIGSRGI